MVKYIALALLCLSCTDDDRTIQTLNNAGFTDIETTGYEFFDCSEDDTFKTGFKAKNINGMPVSGTVCCGMMKNCTIRY